VADVFGNELEDVAVDFVLVEVDRGHAVLRREEVRDLAVGDVAELGEGGPQVLAGAALLVLSLPELLQADELLANEELAEPIDVGHVRPRLASFGGADAGRKAASTRHFLPM